MRKRSQLDVRREIRYRLITLTLPQCSYRCNEFIIYLLRCFVFSSIMTVFGILLFGSTSYDLMVRRSNGKDPHKLLIAFSLYTNGKSIFNINKQSVDCLEGLRCISLILILLGHRILYHLSSPSTNVFQFYELFDEPINIYLFCAVYCVDTFLVIAGFLSALQMLNAFEKKTFNALRMIVHRYIRYTPILAASLLVFTSLARHVKGPFPDHTEPPEDCEKNWWSTLLHIQNYVNPYNICATHSWYLSVDFQLFVISPLLIYPARRYGWKYLWSLLALAVLSAIGVMITCLANDLRATDDLVMKNFALIYFPTHARMAPWLIGMVLGYIIFESRARKITMNKAIVLLLWILSLSALALLLALIYPFHQISNNHISLKENAIVKGFGHILWSLPIAWIIFACYKLESGGLIRWMLSLREWQPLGKISLTIYIIQNFYLRLTLMMEKTPITMELLPLVRGL